MLRRRVFFAIPLLLAVSAAAAWRVVGLTSGTYLSGTFYLKSHVMLCLERAVCLCGGHDLRGYNAEDAFPQNYLGKNR